MMLGRRPPLFFQFCWCTTAPLITMVSHILISLHSDLVSILYPLSSILYPLRLRIYVIFVHKCFPGTPYGRRRHVLENYLSLDKFAGYLYQDQFKTLEKFY